MPQQVRSRVCWMQHRVVAAIGLAAALLMACSAATAGRTVMGWVEWITLCATGFAMEAKLDSGALTSSLHATDIERFERDGDEWVRFTVHNHEDSAALTLERPVARNVRIKRHGAESQRRAVVELPFCVGGTRYETEFSLVDRSNFIYPVLLGRRFLADVALIDAAEKHLVEPTRDGCDDE